MPQPFVAVVAIITGHYDDAVCLAPVGYALDLGEDLVDPGPDLVEMKGSEDLV